MSECFWGGPGFALKTKPASQSSIDHWWTIAQGPLRAGKPGYFSKLRSIVPLFNWPCRSFKVYGAFFLVDKVSLYAIVVLS